MPRVKKAEQVTPEVDEAVEPEVNEQPEVQEEPATLTVIAKECLSFNGRAYLAGKSLTVPNALAKRLVAENKAEME